MFRGNEALADKFAIFLSGLCIAHCFLPPLLVLLIPYYAGLAFLADEAFHIWLLLFVFPISIMAIAWGYRKHRNNKPLALAFVGLFLILMAATLAHDLLGHSWEVVFTTAGALVLVAGHLKNIKLRKALSMQESTL